MPVTTPGRDRPGTRIAPSILSSDFARLRDEGQRMKALGADWLHVDVMDGHFVPNLTLGPPVVRSLRKATDLFLDCHLMVSEPWKWVEAFGSAGADGMTFHLEAGRNAEEGLQRLCERVKENGMRVGVAVRPKTGLEEVSKLVEAGCIDMVLVMTVEPGFGGQKFMRETMEKVRLLRKKFPSLDIEVDGGLNPETVHVAAEAGANVVVAGSAIFGADDPGKVIKQLRNAVDAAAGC